MREETYSFVIAANRLPVDRHVGPDGEQEWRRSPGGLVTAMDSVMRGREGAAWVGWAGEPGEAPEPFEDSGMHLHPVALSEQEGLKNYYWDVESVHTVSSVRYTLWWCAYRTCESMWSART